MRPQHRASPESLTAREVECYRTVEHLTQVRGYAPTVREIGTAMRVKECRAFHYVTVLCDRGWLLRDAGVARSIRLSGRVPPQCEPAEARTG